MAYTSVELQGAVVELTTSTAATGFTLTALALLASRKGLSAKAFSVWAETPNAITGKPMSTKLPWSIGSKLQAHMPDIDADGTVHKVEDLELEDAFAAASDYVMQHKAWAETQGSKKWDAWAKIAHLPIDAAEGATIVAAHDAAKAESAAKREADAAEREALIAAGKAAGHQATQPLPPSDLTAVDREALVAAAVALIGLADHGDLDQLTALIQSRREALMAEEMRQAA